MSQSFQKTSVEKKPQARSLQTLQVYYMLKQRRFHEVSTSFQHGTHTTYL